MQTVGVVCNPIAGMGGRVGLKGTDDALEAAVDRGATPRARERARSALESLFRHAPDTQLYCWGDPMGTAEAREAGFDPTVLGSPLDARGSDIDALELQTQTTAGHTADAVRAFLRYDVDLVLFVGGDGTARDVAATLEAVERDVPMLGVPAGVKLYSAVFAVSPDAAGQIAGTFNTTESRELNDIDEAAYREGTVRSSLQAVVSVPVGEALQSGKQTLSGRTAGLAAGVAEEIDPDTTYVFAPGSTVGAIEAELGVDGSPLGVDVYRDGELLVRDGAEQDILEALDDESILYVSPTGGQGFVFGRGNDQLSPAVLDTVTIQIVGSPAKIDDLGVLRADTGDGALDDQLRGWWRVRVGRFDSRLVELV